MKRASVLITVFLLAGAIVNVAVAWAPMLGLGLPIEGKRRDLRGQEPSLLRMERSYGPLGMLVRLDVLSNGEKWTLQLGTPWRSLELQRKYDVQTHTGILGPVFSLPPTSYE